MNGMDTLRAALETDRADVEQHQRVETVSAWLANTIRDNIAEVTRIQESLSEAVSGGHPVLVLFCLHLLTANARRGLVATRAPGMLDLDAACIALAQEMSDHFERAEQS
jgi:hypothetical protein